MANPLRQHLALAGAERRSALQRAILALVMPTHKRHFAPGDLQFLTSSTYHRAKLFESDRFRWSFVEVLGQLRIEMAFLLLGWPDFSLVSWPQSCALRQPAPPAEECPAPQGGEF